MRAQDQCAVLEDAMQELGYQTRCFQEGSAATLQIRDDGAYVATLFISEDGSISIDYEKQPGLMREVLGEVRLTKYVADSKVPFKRLEIFGKRWFQKTYGNTYHTTEIIIDNKLVHKTSKSYGYGDQYLQTAVAWLVKEKILPSKALRRPIWQLRDEMGFELSYHTEDVRRERDL